MVGVVTGAASGLGKAIAGSFARRGLPVALLDWNRELLDEVAASLQGGDARVGTYQVDVSDEASVAAAFAALRSELGAPSILVNAAGVADMQPAGEMPLEAWQRTLAINLTGTFICCRAAYPDMRAAGHGRIVNLASVSGMRASVGRIAYGTSKAGVISMTAQLAVEWAPHGITVNAIAPGPIESPMSASLGAANRAAYLSRIPAGRYGDPAEIVHAVEFLAGEEAGYITGHTLVVDGGFAIYGLPPV